MMLQPDGKIVIAGASGYGFALARYGPDGSVDPTFGTAGLVTTRFLAAEFAGAASAVAIQADGKIVAAGTTTVAAGGPGAFAVARYLP